MSTSRLKANELQPDHLCLGWFWINPFGCYFTPRKVVVVCPLWCKCVSVCQHIVHHFCGAELLALAKTSFSWISFRANSLEEKHRVSNAFFSCCGLRHLHSRKFVSFPATGWRDKVPRLQPASAIFCPHTVGYVSFIIIIIISSSSSSITIRSPPSPSLSSKIIVKITINIHLLAWCSSLLPFHFP